VLIIFGCITKVLFIPVKLYAICPVPYATIVSHTVFLTCPNQISQSVLISNYRSRDDCFNHGAAGFIRLILPFTQSHTRILARTFFFHTNAHMSLNAPTHLCTHTPRTHAPTLAFKHIHTHTHTHTHTKSYTVPHVHTHTHIHKHARAIHPQTNKISASKVHFSSISLEYKVDFWLVAFVAELWKVFLFL